MKKITLLAAIFAAFTMNAQVTIFEDGFETYTAFEFENIGDWTQIDLDGGATYGSTDYDFPNESYTGTGIIFNPSMTDPDSSGTDWSVRTGDQGLYFFASQTLLNDDYFITPQIDLTGASGGTTISFWAKSLTDAYGLERFEVLLSTTGTDVADFSVDLGGGELQAPITDYTEYLFDLSAYEGGSVYIAIHYVAQDSFVFQVDDFLVETTTLGVEDNQFEGFAYYVNANSQLVLSASTSLENVQLFNLLGQQVVSQRLSNTNETVDIASIDSGIYVAKVTIEGITKTFKIIKN